jgi:hypothetical protein
MLRRVALVRTDVSEERSASIIRVTRINELGTMLAVTSNRRTLHYGRYVCPKRQFTFIGLHEIISRYISSKQSYYLLLLGFYGINLC